MQKNKKIKKITRDGCGALVLAGVPCPPPVVLQGVNYCKHEKTNTTIHSQ